MIKLPKVKQRRSWWAYYYASDSSLLYLLGNSRMTEAAARKSMKELPRKIDGGPMILVSLAITLIDIVD